MHNSHREKADGAINTLTTKFEVLETCSLQSQQMLCNTHKNTDKNQKA